MIETDSKVSVLVLEDEAIIGMDIAMSLQDAGFAVHGPFKTPEKALESLARERPSFAVLDLNLGHGKTSRDVADALSQQGCPFVFLTGYGAASHPVIEQFGEATCLSKPVDMDSITQIIRERI